ncbi:hypothetical protein BCV72DRAFT_197826, partial [Rhizopus microsporus var. microsporus]
PVDGFRLSFLFLDLRPSSLRSFTNPLHLLFYAIDPLPMDFSPVVPNANTCLQLPVSAAVRTLSNITLTRSLSQLRLSTFSIQNPNSHPLRVRCQHELYIHPILSRKVLGMMIRNNQILLFEFLVQPFIPAAYAPFICIKYHCLSRRFFIQGRPI